MRVPVKRHALPVYKKNRIASLLCIFETTIVWMCLANKQARYFEFNTKQPIYHVLETRFGPFLVLRNERSRN